MSGKVSGWVWDQKDLTQQEKYVLLCYADHADHDGRNVFPSNDLIAKKTGYTVRSVQRYVRKLEEKGYLVPDGQHKNDNGKFTNKWKIPIEAGATPVSSQSSETTAVADSPDTRDRSPDSRVAVPRQGSVTQTVINRQEPSEEPSISVPKRISTHADDVFRREAKLEPSGNTGYDVKRWHSPIRRICKLVFLEDEEQWRADVEALIVHTVKSMDADELDYDSPASIERVARSIVAKVKRGKFKPKQSLDDMAENYERRKDG